MPVALIQITTSKYEGDSLFPAVEQRENNFNVTRGLIIAYMVWMLGAPSLILQQLLYIVCRILRLWGVRSLFCLKLRHVPQRDVRLRRFR